MAKSSITDFTSGNVFSILMKFSIPYLLSCFLQTFYGLADLFITGQFYGAETISAVSIGSQLMHMITVIIVGLAMGTTVSISRAVGLKNKQALAKNIGNSVKFFLIFSLFLTIILIFTSQFWLKLISTPQEAFQEASFYCFICFAGIPLITAYNILSSIYRGLGDSSSPMVFIFVAGVFNIVLDYFFIGWCKLGASGAALGTVISQAISVCFGICVLIYKQKKLPQGEKLSLKKSDFKFDKTILSQNLKIGVPVGCQDGFIQISFLVITAIGNSRGVTIAAAIGIVEKIICFLFLVPSAMLSSLSAISAQNASAGKDERGIKALKYGILITIIFGVFVTILGNIFPEQIIELFAKGDKDLIARGSEYLRSYVTDCIVAGVHFCFSGFFCAYGKSVYSFIHNTLSILLIRIPGTYFASIFYPETLFPMGLAAPLGSLFSAIVCIFLFIHLRKSMKI